MLKAAREQWCIFYNGILTILTTDLSSDMTVARGQGVTFSVLKRKKQKTKQKNHQPRILYPAKLTLRNESEIKTFPDKQKHRISLLAHQEMDFLALSRNAKGSSSGWKQVTPDVMQKHVKKQGALIRWLCDYRRQHKWSFLFLSSLSWFKKQTYKTIYNCTICPITFGNVSYLPITAQRRQVEANLSWVKEMMPGGNLSP